jgi:type IV secretion system protein VirD4
MLQLIFNRLMEQLDPDRHHLLLMLDEFPELRKIPNLSAAMSLMAGYKIKPYLIAQTLTQIIDEYGPNESITDNCYIKAAFQTDNLQTCKNLSELSGNMTVEKETVAAKGWKTAVPRTHKMGLPISTGLLSCIASHSVAAPAAKTKATAAPTTDRRFQPPCHCGRLGRT